MILYWEKFNELIEKEEELSTKLGELISDDQLSSIIGSNNLKNIKNKKGQVRPQNLLGIMKYQIILKLVVDMVYHITNNILMKVVNQNM